MQHALSPEPIEPPQEALTAALPVEGASAEAAAPSLDAVVSVTQAESDLAAEAREMEEVAKRPRGIPWVRWLLMAGLLALAVRMVVPQLGPIESSLSTLHNMVPAYVAAAFLAQAASFWFSGVMLRHIVQLTGDELSTGRGVAVSLGSGSVGLVAAGAIGTAGSTFRWLRDVGVSPEGALLAGWLPTVLNAVVTLALGILGTAQIVAFGALTPGQWTALGLALAITSAVAGFLWWAAGHPAPAERLAVAAEARWARIRRHPPRERQVRERVEATYAALALLRHRGWIRPAMDALLVALFDALTLWFVFVSLLDVVSPHVFFAGYAIPLMVGKVGMVPGGVGLVEGMMVGVFHHVGETGATAALAVVGYRLLAFWLPTLVGFCVLPFLQAAPRRRRAAVLAKSEA